LEEQLTNLHPQEVGCLEELPSLKQEAMWPISISPGHRMQDCSLQTKVLSLQARQARLPRLEQLNRHPVQVFLADKLPSQHQLVDSSEVRLQPSQQPVEDFSVVPNHQHLQVEAFSVEHQLILQQIKAGYSEAKPQLLSLRLAVFSEHQPSNQQVVSSELPSPEPKGQADNSAALSSSKCNSLSSKTHFHSNNPRLTSNSSE